ncbi:MAG: D-alanine--D-alanine ligase family protein, partial [Longimicrobiales bacterium]
DQQRDQLHELTSQVWRIVDGRGYGRVDFRMADDGRIYILEFNPNPDIAPGAGLTRMARAHGWDYAALIERILDEAVK